MTDLKALEDARRRHARKVQGSGRAVAALQNVDAGKVRKATGETGTFVFSVRLPADLQEVIESIAFEHGISTAEIKKAIIFRGLQAFVLDGEAPAVEVERGAVAKLPQGL